MLDKLKKHSVKIFVFTINILLAAIVVLIIREKDQARLLKNAQKEVSLDGNVQSSPTLPSFENSVSAENTGSDLPPDVQNLPVPADNSIVVPPPAPAPSSVPVTKPATTPVPKVSAPTTNSTSNNSSSTTQITKPSNAKTKTS